jgi:hypothetical protein
MMIARLGLYLALSFSLSSLECHWNTPEFWCFIALFWAADALGHIEGAEAVRDAYEELLDDAIKQIKHIHSLLDAARDQARINEIKPKDIV